MLDEGYTLDGAAQAFGWTRQLAGARAKILKLPPVAQELVGGGEIPVSAVENLLTVNVVSPALAQASPRRSPPATCAAESSPPTRGGQSGAAPCTCPRARSPNTSSSSTRRTQGLRLGKKMDGLVAEAVTLHKQVEQYAYGPPAFRFTQQDADQARAAGVLIEFEPGGGHGHTAPTITDQAVYRELAKQVIPRTVEELRVRLAAKGNRKAAAGAAGGPGERDTPGGARHRASRDPARVHPPGAPGQPRSGDGAPAGPHGLPRGRQRGEVLRLRTAGPGEHRLPRDERPAARTIAANGVRLVLEEHRRSLRSGSRAASPARRRSPTARSRTPAGGCGSSWPARRPRAMCTRAPWSSTRRSTTPRSSCCRPRSGAARRCRAPTRTPLARRSSRSPRASCPPATSSCSGRSPPRRAPTTSTSTPPRRPRASSARPPRRPARSSRPAQNPWDAAPVATLDEDLDVDDHRDGHDDGDPGDELGD